MTRPKKTPKNPGRGRPGQPRKYAKDKPPQAPKTARQPPAATTPEPHGLEIDFFTPPLMTTPDHPPSPEPETPQNPLIDNNIYIDNKGISKKIVIERGIKNNKVDSNNPPQDQQDIKENSPLVPEIIEDTQTDQSFDLKSQLTVKELNFIEIYLSGGLNENQAMDLAGYKGLHPTYQRKLACKIIAKYECQAGDRRNIMRARGYGEVKILDLLIESATKAKSETVKLNARIALAKCIGMHKEVLEGLEEGITLVFQAVPPTQDRVRQEPGTPTAPISPGPRVRMIK